MTSRKWTLAALVAAAIACIAQPSLAQAPAKGTYVGVNAGQSDYKWRNPPGAAGGDLCSAGVQNCDDTPAGYKVYAGYNFTNWLGVEGIYYYHGRARQSADLGGGNVLEQSVLLNGYGLSLVATAPLGQVAFISGRVGYAAATATRKDSLLGVTNTHERSEGQPMIGAAIGFKVWRSLFVRADWDRVRGETSFDEKFESDLFSLGVMWQF